MLTTESASGTYSKNSTRSIIDDAKNGVDGETEALLKLLADQELIRKNRIEKVRTVLVVLSSKAMAFDPESMKKQVLLTYPDATVFFRTTQGKPIGSVAPHKVDLLIDFTSPKTRQGFFYPRKLRSIARVAVGRNAGWFGIRKRSYDRIFDEKAKKATIPADLLERERFVQRQVLGLAGIALSQRGETPPDRGQTIALELPAMAKL